jgi:glyoxylase-like metal-dependent hydrolase (beta-lactamase superfamily II)
MYKMPIHRLTTILVTVLLWSPFLATAQEDKAGPIRAQYHAEQVSPSTYVIHGPLATPNPDNQGFMNNPAFIVGDSGIIVIDSGSTVQAGDMVLKLIKTVSDLPVVATFSTHIHGDHWLGNQAIAEAYPEATHYAHPNLIEQANDGEAQSWVELMNSFTEGASAGTVYITPDALVDEGSRLTIEGKNFAIYHDPVAHTDSDIAIELLDERVVFLGDTVMNRRLGRIDDGSFKGLIAFLNRMLDLDAAVYVPGHGQTGSIEVVETFKDFKEMLYSTVKEEYDNGLADFEIKPIVENKIADKAYWVDLDEALGKLISLAYLEVEEDAF